jgi:hypothetical protein
MLERINLLEQPKFDVEKMLTGSLIDLKKQVSRPPVILSIIEKSGTQTVYKRLLSLGNFSCLIGKAKSRKTFLIGLLTASVLADRINSKFKRDHYPDKPVVLYFDTEQGEYDSHATLSRIENMATYNRVGTLLGFSLRQFSPAERCAIVEHAFVKWGKSTSLCVIDGIADLGNAINDEMEATRLTSMLLRLTKEYNCHISTVLHQNKNDNFATGWIGSQIMKKAELVLSVKKSEGNSFTSDVNCDLSRAIEFQPFSIFVDQYGIPHVSDDSFDVRDIKPPTDRLESEVNKYIEKKMNDEYEF